MPELQAVAPVFPEMAEEETASLEMPADVSETPAEPGEVGDTEAAGAPATDSESSVTEEEPAGDVPSGP